MNHLRKFPPFRIGTDYAANNLNDQIKSNHKTAGKTLFYSYNDCVFENSRGTCTTIVGTQLTG